MAMEIVDRLDRLRGSLNVLEHPFYQRWNAGELSAQELGLYAAEYRHAVLALARASELAAEQAPPERAAGLRHHAEEELGHVGMWDAFAGAAGARDAGAGTAAVLPQTDACVQAWTAGEGLLEHLAVLYVLEAGQPQISKTKMEGLTAHYGYTPEGPATEYFRVHELLDVEHARQAGALITELMAEVADAEQQAERMVERAAEALRGNWLLLDGVEAEAAA
jgi:pyrroloquinoline-quinone synthase